MKEMVLKILRWINKYIFPQGNMWFYVPYLLIIISVFIIFIFTTLAIGTLWVGGPTDNMGRAMFWVESSIENTHSIINWFGILDYLFIVPWVHLFASMIIDVFMGFWKCNYWQDIKGLFKHGTFEAYWLFVPFALFNEYALMPSINHMCLKFSMNIATHTGITVEVVFLWFVTLSLLILLELYQVWLILSVIIDAGTWGWRKWISVSR